LYKGLANLDIFKCSRADEVYSSRCEDGFIKYNIDLVIFHHLNDMIKMSKRVDFRGIYVENIPRLVETSIFRDFGEKKIYDLLLIGHTNRNVYPFRCRLGDIVKSRVFNKYVKSTVRHPGYEIASPMKVQENFSREINKAKIVITCSSKFKYALSKYVEVPRSHALLAADLPDERHSFYSSYMLVLDPNDSDASICSALLYWLIHDSEREELTKKGYDLVSKERNSTVYANNFVNIVSKYF
jgi:spore maturation protein CgeB